MESNWKQILFKATKNIDNAGVWEPCFWQSFLTPFQVSVLPFWQYLQNWEQVGMQVIRLKEAFSMFNASTWIKKIHQTCESLDIVPLWNPLACHSLPCPQSCSIWYFLAQISISSVSLRGKKVRCNNYTCQKKLFSEVGNNKNSLKNYFPLAHCYLTRFTFCFSFFRIFCSAYSNQFGIYLSKDEAMLRHTTPIPVSSIDTK